MKIPKRRKVFSASTILAYVPETLEPNADLRKFDMRKFKVVRMKSDPRDEEVRWMKIRGWHVPYMWSTTVGCWFRSTECLFWGDPVTRTVHIPGPLLARLYGGLPMDNPIPPGWET